MKILLISDVHTEFHRDGGRSFLDSLNTDVDVVVIAGDLCLYPDLDKTLRWFVEAFQQVIYLWGNHECWDTEIEKVREEAHYCAGAISNLHILDNTAITIGGQRFVGGTLWFRNDPLIVRSLTKDFERIRHAPKAIYEENARTIEFLEREVEGDDIVVTHYLPSLKSVPFHWKSDHAMNRFFVCDMEDFICRAEPKMWFHGHSHRSKDYRISETRIICNPFGYARVDLNPDFEEDLLIEV